MDFVAGATNGAQVERPRARFLPLEGWRGHDICRVTWPSTSGRACEGDEPMRVFGPSSPTLPGSGVGSSVRSWLIGEYCSAACVS